jgi:hypothetical protein
MTSSEPKRPTGVGGAGYRGTLPPRGDRLARPWLVVVAGIFVLILVLSFVGVPSRLIPDPTPFPLTSIPPASSESPSPTLDGSPPPSASPSPAAS